MIELWIPAAALFLTLLPCLIVDQVIRLMACRQRRESMRTLERLVRQGDLPEAVPPAETVTLLNRDGNRLTGRLLSEGPVRRLVIFTHGLNASGASGLPFWPLLRSMGYALLLADGRGHGGSQGRYTTYGYYEREDLACWVSYARQRWGSSLPIGLMGQSMGAATAMEYAAVDPAIRFVIADSGFTRACDVLKFRLRSARCCPNALYRLIRARLWALCRFPLEQLNPVEDIPLAEAPMLFIRGGRDRIVPPEMSALLLQARHHPADRLYEVPWAAHVGCYHASPQAYLHELRRFIQSAESGRLAG